LPDPPMVAARPHAKFANCNFGIDSGVTVTKPGYPPMPRISAEALALGHRNRLQPPAELTEPERSIFLEIVAGAPADHFAAEDTPLVRAYASAIAQQRRAAAMIASDAVSPLWITMHAAAVASMGVLSIRLRLGVRSRKPNNSRRTAASPPSYYDTLTVSPAAPARRRKGD
jgi:hypothetical protein